MTRFYKEFHPFHIVNPSPWPWIIGISSLNLATGLVLYFHNYKGGFFMMVSGFILVLFFVCCWFIDIVTEATFLGEHTLKVQEGLKIGTLLFIVSEAMLFFSFFWAFFHSALAPGIGIWCVWPPKAIVTIDLFGLPLLNTVLLLSSGVSLTYAHHALCAKQWPSNAKATGSTRNDVLLGLGYTILLGLIFTFCQYIEYNQATFNINDSIYGTIFYMITGLHGFHVLLGTAALIVAFIRHFNYHFTDTQHLGFEFAAWYWHFVDVVWILVYMFVYWWGN